MGLRVLLPAGRKINHVSAICQREADLGLLPRNVDLEKHKSHTRATSGVDQNLATVLARKRILNRHFAKARNYLSAVPRLT
jgi:hypothetical protein